MGKEVEKVGKEAWAVVARTEKFKTQAAVVVVKDLAESARETKRISPEGGAERVNAETEGIMAEERKVGKVVEKAVQMREGERGKTVGPKARRAEVQPGTKAEKVQAWIKADAQARTTAKDVQMMLNAHLRETAEAEKADEERRQFPKQQKQAAEDCFSGQGTSVLQALCSRPRRRECDCSKWIFWEW